MAKRGRKLNGKSAAILEYGKNNPEAKPKEAVAQLKETGVSVRSAFVSTILSNAKRAGKPAKTKRGRPARQPASDGVLMENLLAVKQLVESIGSVDEARNAVEKYSKLMA